MNKYILLHGATNCKSSNYGDYLYGEIIYLCLKEKGFDVAFYQPSEYFMTHIPEYSKKHRRRKPSAVIYVPGGYFGEGHNARFRENIVQFLRFMPIGIWASYRKKPVAVVGVGAGPNSCKLLSYGIKRICNHAKFVSVRDDTSYVALKHLCPAANVSNCADLIIAALPNLKQNYTNQISRLMVRNNGKKILLVHYNNNKLALHLFASAAKYFIKSNSGYSVIVSSDSCLENEGDLYAEFADAFGEECGHLIFDDPAELTALIQQVDMVLTCKLHVGVVACGYEKSVIAVACHPEKTKRFYEQIGTPDRCVSLYDVSSESIASLLEKFRSENIQIPQELINKAQQSWDLLDDFLIEIEEKNDNKKE